MEGFLHHYELWPILAVARKQIVRDMPEKASENLEKSCQVSKILRSRISLSRRSAIEIHMTCSQRSAACWAQYRFSQPTCILNYY